MKRLIILSILVVLLCLGIAEPTCREAKMRYRLEDGIRTYSVYDGAGDLYLRYNSTPEICQPTYVPAHDGIIMVIWKVYCGTCLGRPL